MTPFTYDFGYSWPWTYGHLMAAIVFGLLAAWAWRAAWPRWIGVTSMVLALWAVAGVAIVHGALRFNLPLQLPTDAFLRSGSGRVLDAGAGSGRGTLMVLLSRPQSTVVALDIFSEGYGIEDNTPRRLRANAARAGVADRLEVVTGDMREMPLPTASFDAVVSAYAIDHLSREGISRSLGEVRRVLRPGGEFLLIVIGPDTWVRVAFPFLWAHGYFGPGTASDLWRDRLRTAGFVVREEGTEPGTLYFLARTP